MAGSVPHTPAVRVWTERKTTWSGRNLLAWVRVCSSASNTAPTRAAAEVLLANAVPGTS